MLAMEAYFKLFHGDTNLLPDTDVEKRLTLETAKYIELPVEVIWLFVKCRMFFGMRILKRGIKSSRQIIKKIAKLQK